MALGPLRKVARLVSKRRVRHALRTLCRKMQRGARERNDSALGPLYGPRPEALWKNATSATVELSPRPRVYGVTRPSARHGPRPDTALGPTRLLHMEKCGVGNSRTVAPAAQRRQQ